MKLKYKFTNVLFRVWEQKRGLADLEKMPKFVSCACPSSSQCLCKDALTSSLWDLVTALLLWDFDPHQKFLPYKLIEDKLDAVYLNLITSIKNTVLSH